MTGNNQNTGRVVGVNGNMVSVQFEGNVSMNEICYVKLGIPLSKAKSSVFGGTIAQVQVYEMTNGIQCGDEVEFTGTCLPQSWVPAFWDRLRWTAESFAAFG